MYPSTALLSHDGSVVLVPDFNLSGNNACHALELQIENKNIQSKEAI